MKIYGSSFLGWLDDIRRDFCRQSSRDQREILSEKNLLEHIADHEHDPYEWILAGAWRDDAQTIGQAMQRIGKDRFNRRLARMLCKW